MSEDSGRPGQSAKSTKELYEPSILKSVGRAIEDLAIKATASGAAAKIAKEKTTRKTKQDEVLDIAKHYGTGPKKKKTYEEDE